MAWAMADGRVAHQNRFETHVDTMLKVIEDLPYTVLGVARDAHRHGFL